jgi:short-subunit dehydrogenase
VLITGASSGIGRQSAIRFGRAGAKVILVARNGAALREAVAEIEQEGGEAIHAVADVAEVDQLKAAAEEGVARFGRIDTWVNNAGVGMYTKILDTKIADDRRLFETNFWGLVNGSRLAVPYLRAAGGGALINVGSEVSDISIPIQGMYATSKHAVLGFTDALREEILADGLPISVTLIKPAAINTPFPRHAKNNFDRDATLPAPVYAVDLVADQIARRGARRARILRRRRGKNDVIPGPAFPDVDGSRDGRDRRQKAVG